MAPYLKRRILGAVITVLIVAIALPVILDSTRYLENPFFETEELPEVPTWAQVQQQKIDHAELERIASGQAKAELLGSTEPLIVEDEPMPVAAPAQPQQSSKQQPKQSAQPTSKPQISAKPAALPLAWVLQVGAFSQQQNANDMVKTLRAKNYKAFAEATPNGKLVRVYVGPELDRRAIERLQQRLQQDLKQNDIHIKRWQPSH